MFKKIFDLFFYGAMSIIAIGISIANTIAIAAGLGIMIACLIFLPKHIARGK